MPFKKSISIVLFLALFFFSFQSAQAQNPGSELSGKILLQVEANGEAWYVNPENETRYFMGRPIDSFKIMRELGLGISEKNIKSFLEQGQAPERLAGKILLRVEKEGQAYYVHPDTLRLHSLNNPSSAFSLMRELGIGITNEDLKKIPVANYHEQDIANIKKYYDHIENGELKKAYDMYTSPNVSYKEYKKWYQDTVKANPRNIREVRDYHTFFVDLKDKNSEIQTYRVKMKVNSGKLNTLSSRKLASDIVSFKDMKAFSLHLKTDEGTNQTMMLSKWGRDIIVEEDPLKDSSRNCHFYSDFEFLHNGKYLKYQDSGCGEVRGSTIYDIQKEERKITYIMEEYGFSQEGKYFYFCNHMDFGGNFDAYVLSTPDFNKKVDILKAIDEKYNNPEKYWVPECSMDPKKNNLKVKASPYMNDTQNNIEAIYDFDTGELQMTEQYSTSSTKK